MRDVNSTGAALAERTHNEHDFGILPLHRSLTRRARRKRASKARIAVHDVVGLLQNGETVDSITATCFPTLTKAQAYECLAYYEDHKGEFDLLIARQMAPASHGIPRGSSL